MVNGPDHAAAVFTDRARDPVITDRRNEDQPCPNSGPDSVERHGTPGIQRFDGSCPSTSKCLFFVTVAQTPRSSRRNQSSSAYERTHGDRENRRRPRAFHTASTPIHTAIHTVFTRFHMHFHARSRREISEFRTEYAVTLRSLIGDPRSRRASPAVRTTQRTAKQHAHHQVDARQRHQQRRVQRFLGASSDAFGSFQAFRLPFRDARRSRKRSIGTPRHDRGSI